MRVYNAVDIANFFVFLLSDSCDDLTNMKLNKLVYYAQGHYLKKYGRPLFAEEMLAWEHGPVIREVYDAYKSYHSSCVQKYNPARIDVISDDDKSFLVEVARAYGRYTAATLRNMTHKPKSPWASTQENGIIRVDAVKDYFTKYENAVEQPRIEYEEDDYIGRRDSDGVLVLPKDWDDETV